MNENDINTMVEEIMEVLGEDSNINEKVVKNFVNMYSLLVCNETCYKELPKQFYPYVFSATIESCQRIGNEAMTNRNELGVSTTYSYKDVEESIRKKVRGKKNPRAYLGNWS